MKLLFLPVALLGLVLAGCEGDVKRPTNETDVKINPDKGLDINPKTDHDVDVTPRDIDVDVKNDPRNVPDIDIDVDKPADRDTNANESEPPGLDTK